jgi:hypothetical protein
MLFLIKINFKDILSIYLSFKFINNFKSKSNTDTFMILSNPRITTFFRLAIVIVIFGCVTSTIEELKALMDKTEDTVLKFAKEVETVYAARCTGNLDHCEKTNYDNCNTIYPYQSCIDQHVDGCGGCHVLFDYTVSSVRLAKSIPVDATDSPTHNECKETVCYGRQLEEFFRARHKENKESG